MLVTRAEEWWIEAESLEEAEALLVAGGPSGDAWRAYSRRARRDAHRREAEVVSKKAPPGLTGFLTADGQHGGRGA